MKVESRLSKERNGKLQCLVCRQKCIIAEGKRGICKTVVNEGRKLYSIIYGTLTAEAVDPIEKKPLFHFWPNSKTYSISSSSCNFKCSWCQNWHLSSLAPEETTSWESTPEEVVEKASSLGLNSISYTYNEPSLWFEFIYDTAKLAKKRGMYNILVTNGYYSHEALEEYSGLIDAVNIDVKGFNEKFYRKYIKASLEKTLESILETYRSGIHVELTMLIIPTLNDNPSEINEFIKWVLDEMGPDIPIHFTKFFPAPRFLRYFITLVLLPGEMLHALAHTLATYLLGYPAMSRLGITLGNERSFQIIFGGEMRTRHALVIAIFPLFVNIPVHVLKYQP